MDLVPNVIKMETSCPVYNYSKASFCDFFPGSILQIRVSSKISDGTIILNVDCDMYSNSSSSIRDALCFFMDEKKGQEIAFVQFPQIFANITKNDLYSGSLRVIREVMRHTR